MSGTSPLVPVPACKFTFFSCDSPSFIRILSEYDFFTFNTIGGNGTIGVTTYVAPTLNANGLDRPVAVAVQVDSDEPQTTYFIPPAAAGAEPAAWDGLDGFVVSGR